MSDPGFVVVAVGEARARARELTAALDGVGALREAPTAEGLEGAGAVVLASADALPNPVPIVERLRAAVPLAQVVFLGESAELARIRQTLILYGSTQAIWSFLKTDQPEDWRAVLKDARARHAHRLTLKQSTPARAGIGPVMRASRPSVPEGAYLRSVLEQADEGILFLNPQGEIVSWNGSAEVCYGEVTGLGGAAEALVAPADRARYRDALATALHEDRSVLVQLSHLRGGGEPFPSEASLTPVKDWRGVRVGVTMIARDITERLLAERTERAEIARQATEAYAHRLETANEELHAAHEEAQIQAEELQAQAEEISRLYDELRHHNERVEAEVARRTQELEQANVRLLEADRYKDEFLSVISHELRTPLNFIMGFASVLEDGVVGPINDEQASVVGKIIAGSDRMLGLVNDLLDFARMQAGRLELFKTRTSLAPVVDEAIASLRPLAEQKRITLVERLDVDEPLPMDTGRVGQVLLNLVANAIKFTDEGGRIVVRGWLEGERAVVEVCDTGVGIAEADLPKLFSPFQQLDMSLTRRTGGTGLGLSITRALVEGHGGTISATSDGPGKGTCFRFTLPLV